MVHIDRDEERYADLGALPTKQNPDGQNENQVSVYEILSTIATVGTTTAQAEADDQQDQYKWEKLILAAVIAVAVIGSLTLSAVLIIKFNKSLQHLLNTLDKHQTSQIELNEQGDEPVGVEVGDRLGVGHHGEVFKGYLIHKSGRRKLAALKKVGSWLYGERAERVASDLRNEAEQMRRLNHPNLLSLITTFDIDQRDVTLVLELADLGSLFDILRRPGFQLGRELEICIAWQTVKAMQHLHENNITHRDLAARNVLLTHLTCRENCDSNSNSTKPVVHDIRAKVCDFGLSRELVGNYYAAQMAQRELPVTCCAPEALKTGLYSKASDVWTFGVLLYEIATRATPHTQRLQEFVITVAMGYLPEMPSDCTPELVTLRERCCVANRYNRPTFNALEPELAAIHDHASTSRSSGTLAIESMPTLEILHESLHLRTDQ